MFPKENPEVAVVAGGVVVFAVDPNENPVDPVAAGVAEAVFPNENPEVFGAVLSVVLAAPNEKDMFLKKIEFVKK